MIDSDWFERFEDGAIMATPNKSPTPCAAAEVKYPCIGDARYEETKDGEFRLVCWNHVNIGVSGWKFTRTLDDPNLTTPVFPVRPPPQPRLAPTATSDPKRLQRMTSAITMGVPKSDFDFESTDEQAAWDILEVQVAEIKAAGYIVESQKE